MTGRRAAQSAIWLPVPGWPHYEADPVGEQVRSIDRLVVDTRGRRRFRAGQILAPIPQAHGGRDRVNLVDGPRRQALTVARVVAAAVAAAEGQA